MSPGTQAGACGEEAGRRAEGESRRRPPSATGNPFEPAQRKYRINPFLPILDADASWSSRTFLCSTSTAPEPSRTGKIRASRCYHDNFRLPSCFPGKQRQCLGQEGKGQRPALGRVNQPSLHWPWHRSAKAWRFLNMPPAITAKAMSTRECFHQRGTPHAQQILAGQPDSHRLALLPRSRGCRRALGAGRPVAGGFQQSHAG
jgi:hypothetical protein